MNLRTESYEVQRTRWPQAGRHILAQYDAEKIVVYQAFCPKIGRYAAEHGFFGGEFSLTRMSWIKPNFLWMMYRCGWATKEKQETVLAVSLKIDAFDAILAEAVPSTFISDLYPDETVWRQAVARSQVRLQWDPDHHPRGNNLERRAVQLGLRGEFLARYAQEWIVGIEDITEFVISQHQNVQAGDMSQLMTPREEVYSVNDILARQLRLAAWKP